MSLSAQYLFEGFVDKDYWQGDVYLSIVEDYRKLDGIDNEQIIRRVSTDSSGYFRIQGNQLEDVNRMYKLHVNNCKFPGQRDAYLDENCTASRNIVFIAKSTDTIEFPLSFERQMFCDIQSNNSGTSALFKIDSIKEQMIYAYSEFRSEANRKLNNKKWFKTLQDYGKQLKEPLAELYIYHFLSDRSKQFHKYYLADLKNNPYYDGLLARLKERYPNSSYHLQYKTELASDRYIISDNEALSVRNTWIYVLSFLLLTSALLNIWFVKTNMKNKQQLKINTRDFLTNQEKKILDHLLQNKTNKEIAESLFVSVSTVKSHVNNIYKKCNVSSRDELKSQFNR